MPARGHKPDLPECPPLIRYRGKADIEHAALNKSAEVRGPPGLMPPPLSGKMGFTSQSARCSNPRQNEHRTRASWEILIVAVQWVAGLHGATEVVEIIEVRPPVSLPAEM